MVDSDEHDDSYVCLGEWTGPPSADEPFRKPVSVHNLEVRDNQGRVRFHGAFTGGFSAGYFNSVGSKEGWKPSTFVSSRESREKQKSVAPEDFMDDEDFGEHGIAPRQIVTSDNFKSEELQRKRKAMASAITSDSFLSRLDSTLMDLIVPEKLSIGVRLLRKMGWKEGQGVGPRYEKQKKKKKKKKKSDSAKMYGPALPGSGSESEASDEYIPDSVTFAPKDTCPISFVPKDNTHGIGYSGINVKAALPSSHISLFSEPYSKPQPKSNIKKKGIRGTAFGVGALEEDDDDIYTMDSLSNYDQSIGGPDADDLFGWTAPGRNKPAAKLPTSYVGKMLDGFTLASTPLSIRKVYHLPLVPKNYKPFHIFKEIPCDLKLSIPDQKNQPLNALSRSIALGEISTEGSIFDLLKKDDADRLTKLSGGNQKSSALNEMPKNQAINSETQSQPISAVDKIPSFTSATAAGSSGTFQEGSMVAVVAGSSTSQETSLVPVEPKQEEITTERDKLGVKPFKIQTTQLPQTSNCFQAGFQPFAKDPAKQERYDRYLLLLKHGKIDPYDDVSAGCEMTEWERTKEKEEFTRSAKIFKPLSGFMATRFTAAKFDDEDAKAQMPIDESADKDDLSRAADMKLFGKLTRETFEWHPDQLLCRRFNVPDPHPGSGIIGIPKVKRDKYSVFTFLEAAHSKDAPSKTNVFDAPSTASASSKAANPERPSIFSHLMDPSPADSKPTLPAADKGSASSTSSTLPVSMTDITTEIKDGERPPLDLFKAIFADSSSSSSEDEDEDKHGLKGVKIEPDSAVKSHNGKRGSVAMTIDNSIKDLPRSSERSSSRKSRFEPSDETSSWKASPETSAKNKFWDCIITNEKKESCHVTNEEQSSLEIKPEKDDSSDGEAYGPALPPTFTTSEGPKEKSTSHLDNQLLSLLKAPSSKKHKHKSKHKSKKSKKEKHKHKKEKRHKDKKKKKHSSKRRDSPSSSSTSSSSS